MDGTKLTEIVTNIGITALTLDKSRKRLYWISDYVNIESSNYDGSNRQSFFTDTVTISTITVLDDRIYWLWPSHGHVTSLLSCAIGKNDTCLDYKIHDIDDVSNAESIKGYSSHARSIENPCQIKNGGCQQLCLISGKNRRSCSCRVGWQLNSDRRSCREAHEFVLYPHGDVIRASSLDGSKDLIWPTKYQVESLKAKRDIDFDYDLRNDNFYFSDDFHIYMMKLRSASNQTLVLSSNGSNTIIEDIAFDWLTGNIYFAQRNLNSSNDRSIILFNMLLGESYTKTIMTAKDSPLFAIQRCPYSLVLHPKRGFILYACDLEGPPNIHQSTMNGTSVYRYDHPFLPMSYGRIMAIDYFDDSLYWISFSVDMTFIERTQFERTYTKTLTVDKVRRAANIDVHRRWIFLSNSTSIWRVNKSTGKDLIKIAPRIDDNSKKIAGMKIISEAVQFSNERDHCLENNGGCEQFCFAGDKVTCDCKDGQVAHSDSRCI